MKLLTRATRYQVFVASALLLVGLLATYYVVQGQFREELDEALIAQQTALERFAAQPSTSWADVANLKSVLDLSIGEVPVNSFNSYLTDTVRKVLQESERVSCRELVFPLKVQATTYRASVYRTTEDLNETVSTLWGMLGVLNLLIVLGLLTIGRVLETRVWKPFFLTIDAIKHYRIDKRQPLQLPLTQTHEFTELNMALNSMATAIEADYLRMKLFTESASHEMQTPLGIALAGVEEMLQQPDLKPQQAAQLNTLGAAVGRLARLHKALLLLAKIDNQQFVPNEWLDFSACVLSEINNMQDLFVARAISITTQIAPAIFLSIHAAMASVILQNLFNNSLRHGTSPGELFVQLDANGLVIRNLGDAPSQPARQLIERFQKADASSASLGLGLSIVQAICKAHDYRLHYDFHDGWHTIMVSFK